MACNCNEITEASPLVMCDASTNPPTPVLLHEVYDTNGRAIPLLSTTVIDPDGKGSDGSGYFRSYITTLAGQYKNPNLVTLRRCEDTAAPSDSEFAVWVDPADPANSTVAVRQVDSNPDGTETVTWLDAETGAVFDPTGLELASDLDVTESCWRDTTTGVTRRLLEVTVDADQPVYYQAGVVTTLAATEVRVSCEEETQFATGCATFTDGKQAVITRMIPVVGGTPDLSSAWSVNPADGSSTVTATDDTTVDLSTAVVASFSPGVCEPEPVAAAAKVVDAIEGFMDDGSGTGTLKEAYWYIYDDGSRSGPYDPDTTLTGFVSGAPS